MGLLVVCLCETLSDAQESYGGNFVIEKKTLEKRNNGQRSGHVSVASRDAARNAISRETVFHQFTFCRLTACRHVRLVWSGACVAVDVYARHVHDDTAVRYTRTACRTVGRGVLFCRTRADQLVESITTFVDRQQLVRTASRPTQQARLESNTSRMHPPLPPE